MGAECPNFLHALLHYLDICLLYDIALMNYVCKNSEPLPVSIYAIVSMLRPGWISSKAVSWSWSGCRIFSCTVSWCLLWGEDLLLDWSGERLPSLLSIRLMLPIKFMITSLSFVLSAFQKFPLIFFGGSRRLNGFASLSLGSKLNYRYRSMNGIYSKGLEKNFHSLSLWWVIICEFAVIFIWHVLEFLYNADFVFAGIAQLVERYLAKV